jgi:hypothetical protein
MVKPPDEDLENPSDSVRDFPPRTIFEKVKNSISALSVVRTGATGAGSSSSRYRHALRILLLQRV